MNYRLKFCGLKTKSFDTVSKLLIESAKESDYLVTAHSMPLLTPYSAVMLDIKLVGSSKKEEKYFVLDYDDAYLAKGATVHICPRTLDIDIYEDERHYWGVAGSLFKLIPDLSPAYITSYLIDKKMHAELALFKQFTVVSLPLALQELIAKIN